MKIDFFVFLLNNLLFELVFFWGFMIFGKGDMEIIKYIVVVTVY